MPTTSEWKRHFAIRFRSTDAHLLRGENLGYGPGNAQDMVGYLAEISPPGSLETAERLLQGTVMTVKPVQIPGQPYEGPRDIPTDSVAVRATVERAHEWVRCVRAGFPAGENIRIVSHEEAGPMIRSGYLVAGCLAWMAPENAVEGMLLALRPRPMQSNKVKDLNFAAQLMMREAKSLAPLFTDQ